MLSELQCLQATELSLLIVQLCVYKLFDENHASIMVHLYSVFAMIACITTFTHFRGSVSCSSILFDSNIGEARDRTTDSTP